MDITNIPQTLASQTLIKALEQKNNDQLVALSRVLNLVLGKTAMASVTSTSPVTEPERQALLKQTAAALALINKQITDPDKISPALKAEMSRLSQQQDLIKLPGLKWVSLLVNNRAQLTYTDRPLVVGQSVPVQLQSSQKLVLLDIPELNPNSTSSGKTLASSSLVIPAVNPGPTSLVNGDKNLTPTVNGIPIPNARNIEILNKLLQNALAQSGTTLNGGDDVNASPIKPDNVVPAKNTLAMPNALLKAKNVVGNSTPYNVKDLSLKFSAASGSKNSSPEMMVAKKLVSENLRNLLPHRDTPNVLFSAITQLQQLSTASRSQLFSPGVEQALKSVAEKMRALDSLSQPKLLKEALKNSGVFFEHKLSEILQNKSVGSGTDIPHGMSTRASSGFNPGVINRLTAGISTGNSDSAKFSGAIHNTYQQDLKGALLTLLNRVTQDMTGEKRPLDSEQIQKLLQNLGNTPLFNPSLSGSSAFGKYDLTQVIGVFIQQLMQKPIKELSNKELRTQLLVLLQQHSVHSLARIQLQQLHAINHDLDNTDSASPTSSWQLEIPVKHNNDVQHLHIRIDREWVDDKNESNTNAEKNGDKIKQWSVTLRFDLPTLGEFCAQLAILNTQVSATLWAAQEKTFTQVRDHLEGLRKQLESEGMSVKYLQCMRGIPPEKPMALSYSLIDIST